MALVTSALATGDDFSKVVAERSNDAILTE